MTFPTPDKIHSAATSGEAIARAAAERLYTELQNIEFPTSLGPEHDSSSMFATMMLTLQILCERVLVQESLAAQGIFVEQLIINLTLLQRRKK